MEIKNNLNIILILLLKFVLICYGDFQSVRGSNSLGYQLFHTLANRNEGNIVLSPLSVHSILTMVSTGSSGQTLKEMLDVLQISDNVYTVREEYKQILSSIGTSIMSKNNRITVTLLNKIYIDNEVKLIESFEDSLNDFRTTLDNVNFKEKDKTCTLVNNWVSNATNNRIKQVINPSSLDDNTKMLLVNAIYFNGKWSQYFRESLKPIDFYLSKDKIVPIKAMVKNDRLKVFKTKLMQIIEIPYSDQNYNFYIILPEKSDGLPEVFGNLNLEELDFSSLPTKYVQLYLPKFKIEFGDELTEILRKLGMKTAFNDKARFEGISQSDKLFINKIIQKAYFSIDLDGTEAAASTIAHAVPLSGNVNLIDPMIIKVDRPFLFYIQEKTTKVNLFFGRFSNPNDSEQLIFM